MAHLLEHMVFKGTPTHPQHPARHCSDRGAQFNGTHLDRPHELLRDPAGQRRQPRVRASRSKPTGWSTALVKREDLASEMTVVRNEFERGENTPAQRARRAHHGRGLRVAQLRQVDDRQPQRHRARADRQPAGLLPEVLPAGQRHAGRRRASSTRPRRWSCVAEVLRRDPAARAASWTRPTPRSRRRTASGLVTLRRVGDVGVVGVVYHIPGRPAPGVPRARRCSATSSAPSRRAACTRP